LGIGRSIRRKMVIGLGLLLLLIAASSLTGFLSLQWYHEAVQDLDFTLNRMPQRSKLDAAIGQMFEPLVEEVPLPPEQAYLARQEKFHERIVAAQAAVAEFWNRYDALPPSELVQRQRRFVDAGLTRMKGELEYLDRLNHHVPYVDKPERQIEFMIKRVGLLESIVQEIPDPQQGLSATVTKAVKGYDVRIRWFLITSGLVALLFVGLVVYTYRQIFSPLRKLHRGARRVAQGDFQYSIRLRNVIAHEHGHGKGMLHVCPISASQPKLMEPFINTSYDGPQLDDILNAQRHYGDPLEPNDSAANAVSLGDAQPGVAIDEISIDDNADSDYFSVTIAEPKELQVTVSPTGASYIQGPQTQACNTGSTFDSRTVHDLAVEILDSDGSTILASEDDTGSGESENLSVILEEAGTYYIRVRGDSTNNIQAYEISALAIDLPFLPLSLQLNAPVPDELDPGVAESVSIVINPRDEIVNPASVQLLYRTDGGFFDTIVMTPQGGDVYSADLPGFLCADNPEFYFSVEGDLSGEVALPEEGPLDPFSAVVGDFVTAFADDFQSNMGWSVAGAPDGTFEGEWQRGVPAGDGSRGDPTEDFDGSGSCYLTGNAAGNTDVDGGSTVLTSPAFDVSGNPDATVSYARWYDNTPGDNPNADIFLVEISDNNGASWTNLEIVGPSGPGTAGGWFQSSFRVGDFVSATSQMRVRFTASDLDGGSVVEAAVDAFSVTGLSCEDPKEPQPCSGADFADPLGALDFNDVVAFLSAFSASDPAADLAAPMGTFDFNDVVAYLSLFSAGCP